MPWRPFSLHVEEQRKQLSSSVPRWCLEELHVSWMVKQEEKELVKWVKGQGIPGEGCHRTQMQRSQGKEGLRRCSGACGRLVQRDLKPQAHKGGTPGLWAKESGSPAWSWAWLPS